MTLSKSRNILYHILPYQLLVTVGVVAVLLSFVTNIFDDFYFNAKTKDLNARAVLVGKIVSEVPVDSLDQLQALVQKIDSELDTRITLIKEDGRVLVDSREVAGLMDNHGDRPEIIGALESGQGSSTRYSFTLEQELMYLAKPVVLDSGVIVVRVSVSTEDLLAALSVMKGRIIWGGILVFLLAGALSLFFSLRISKPIQMIKAGAQHFAEGDLGHRLPEFGIGEISSLAVSMNQMAQQLEDRLQDMTMQRDEMRAVLSGMVEGVIAVDPRDHILSMNKAARGILEIKKKVYRGRMVQEVLRHSELIEFLGQVRENKGTLTADITLHMNPPRFIRITGSQMSTEGESWGVVLVMNDVTRTRQLESIRSEFVANVSHELKTPITAIKGFVETLRTLEPGSEDETARFLEIVNKHVDRLNAIINDLLELSRIEEQGREQNVELSPQPVAAVFQKVLQNNTDLAVKNGINLVVEGDDSIEVPMHVQLLEHALNNLLDNAIKYSLSGGNVWLKVEETEKQVKISVQDEGPGIAAEHQERIFERFYRVDKGRSRDLGGTGLGLSIVKHIAIIHHAKVSVKSQPGSGSTFILRFDKS